MAVRILRGLKALSAPPIATAGCVIEPKKCRVAAIGNFDGLHRGHQKLLQRVCDCVRDKNEQRKESGTELWESLLLTFYPHPAVVLGQVPTLPQLDSLRIAVTQLDQIGIDNLCLLRFDSAFAQKSAEDFVQEVLCKRLNVFHLVVGPDAAVGRARAGTVSVLADLLQQRGRTLEVVEFEEQNGSKVSSREIRSIIERGDVHIAAEQLGRFFCLEGRVVRGAGRGKGIGFPTANLAVKSQVLPETGVYAGFVRYALQRHPCVCNIGVRPSFGGGQLTIEAHLLQSDSIEWADDLYGKRIFLEFVARIRSEKKFCSAEALSEQISTDCALATEVLESVAEDGLC